MSEPKRPLSPQEAAEQAAEFFGFAASEKIVVKGPSGDEVFEIVNPGLLDDDQQERWDALQFELQQCDREPDVELPERTVTDPDGTVTKYAAQTLPGDMKQPYQKDGQRLTPSYNARLGIVLWGEEGYARFKAGGGRSSQISLSWARMRRELDERKASDSKSADSARHLEAVPETD